MKFNRKIQFALFLGLIFIFASKTTRAQHAGMSAVYSNMARQQANQNMQFQMMMMSNLRGGDYTYNPKYTFEVVMKDSTKKQVSSRLFNDTVLHKNYLSFVDKKFPRSDSAHRNQRIYPDQTFKISRINYEDKEVKGVANDSCWMFKVITGKVSAYSYLSEESGPGFNPGSIIGIQLNDGPIVKCNVDNLEQMVGQDLDATENIKKKNYLKAINKYNRDAKKAAKK